MKSFGELRENLDKNKMKKMGIDNPLAGFPYNEKTMTQSQIDKREKIVMDLKKNMSDFKKRYGKDAKDVMYATATKLAKEDVTLQDANGNDFLEVVDLIKPDPIKGVATEQKELEPTVDQEPSRKEQEDQKADKKNSKQLKQKEMISVTQKRN